MMKIEVSPCAHCEGKDDENCPCADKTVYDINQLNLRKKLKQRLNSEKYQKSVCKRNIIYKLRRYGK